MKARFLGLGILGGVCLGGTPLALSQDYPVFPQAQPLAREKQYQEQLTYLEPSRYLAPLAQRQQWEQTLWATALLEPQQPYVIKGLASLLAGAMLADLSPQEAQIVERSIQVSNQVYLGDPAAFPSLGAKFREIVQASPSSQWAVMALTALAQGELTPTEIREGMDLLKSRFVRAEDTGLEVALRALQEELEPTPLPPVGDLLRWQIAPQTAQLYVFCRPRREVLCRTLLKDRSGNWVQQGQEKWSVGLLSRSLHRLPWYFLRGDTPPGVYRLEGTMPRPTAAEFRAYGQFPLVKVFLPLESAQGNFAEDLADYRALLPPSWRGYFPLEGTYWAGKLGRSLIRIHGSGENPQLRSPGRSDGYNPTIGCLGALELYGENGQLSQGDMPQILQSLSAAAGGKIMGYLLVVEIPGSDTEPVSWAEITRLAPDVLP